jgi:hypothetical protein
VTSRAIADTPALWMTFFGATQLTDEARHVEFFSRVTAKLGERAEVLPSLRALTGAIGTAETAEELMLGTHVLEGFAQSVFQEGARLSRVISSPRISLPGSDAVALLLRYIDDYVGKDEARHVAFGVLTLRSRWLALDPPNRDRLEQQGLVWADLVSAVLDELTGALRLLGISAADLRSRIQRAQLAHFRSIGFRRLPSGGSSDGTPGSSTSP